MARNGGVTKEKRFLFAQRLATLEEIVETVRKEMMGDPSEPIESIAGLIVFEGPRTDGEKDQEAFSIALWDPEMHFHASIPEYCFAPRISLAFVLELVKQKGWNHAHVKFLVPYGNPGVINAHYTG